MGCILCALFAPALAQNLSAGLAPAAAGPTFDASVGYTNVTMLTSGQHVNMGGLDLAGHVDLNPFWGAMLDTSYVRTADVLGTGHPAYQWSFLGGPMIYPAYHGKTRVFVRGLVGAALVDGAVPISKTDYAHGWMFRFSYALGGGVERGLSGPFGVRVGADYQHAAYFDGTGAVRPQGNVRLTASLVYRLHLHDGAK